MASLKASAWELLVEATALTSIAALIALVGTMLLARSLASLTSLVRMNGKLSGRLRAIEDASLPPWVSRYSDKTLRGVD
jgi:hypothetical protein